MTTYVNDNGTGKEPNMIYVKDNGTGKEAAAAASDLLLYVEGQPDSVLESPRLEIIVNDEVATSGESVDGEVGNSDESSQIGSDTTGTDTKSVNVPSGNLSDDTEYVFKARVETSSGTYTDYDSVTATTEFIDYENDIGESIDGGYNAGTITYNSTDYAIIVSPKSEGESSQIEWSSDINTEYGCTDDKDGKSNTNCMLDNDTTLSIDTATEFIDDIQTNGINGYNDGYIPAIDELQMMYENMYKEDKNETLSGTDWYDDGETFEYDYYWSSTEFSSTNAYRYNFSYGGVTDSDKDYAYYVRAVRRVSL